MKPMPSAGAGSDGSDSVVIVPQVLGSFDFRQRFGSLRSDMAAWSICPPPLLVRSFPAPHHPVFQASEWCQRLRQVRKIAVEGSRLIGWLISAFRLI